MPAVSAVGLSSSAARAGRAAGLLGVQRAVDPGSVGRRVAMVPDARVTRRAASGRRSGQRVAASPAATTRPSSSREARQRSRWVCVVPDRVEAGLGHGARRIAEHGEQPAAALAVGAGVGLHRAGRSVVRRAAGARARRRSSTTGQAAHFGRSAVQTSAPSSITATDQVAAVGGSSGSSASATARSALVTERAGNSTPDTARAEHPADVGVEHDLPLAVGERRDRRGGVVADAGEGAERVVRVGYDAAVVGSRSRPPPRAAAARGAGSRAGPRRAPPRRSARRPGRPASASAPATASCTGSTRDTGVCCSMNSETSTDHADARRAPPRQVAGVRVVPPQDRVDEARTSPSLCACGASASAGSGSRRCLAVGPCRR